MARAYASREDIQRAMGACLDAWAGLELHLSRLFCGLHDKGHTLGQAFDAVQSFEVRKVMVDTSFLWVEMDDEVRGNWASLSNKINRLASKRAQIAHGTIVSAPPDGHYLQPYFSISMLADGYKRQRPALWHDDLIRREQAFQHARHRVGNFAFYFDLLRGNMRGNPEPIKDPLDLIRNSGARCPAKSVPPSQSSPE